MTIRDAIITKLNNLPEALLQQVNDFIDLVALRDQSRLMSGSSQEEFGHVWERWFEVTNQLDVTPARTTREYQELLLEKYRQQGLDL